MCHGWEFPREWKKKAKWKRAGRHNFYCCNPCPFVYASQMYLPLILYGSFLWKNLTVSEQYAISTSVSHMPENPEVSLFASVCPLSYPGTNSCMPLKLTKDWNSKVTNTESSYWTLRYSWDQAWWMNRVWLSSFLSAQGCRWLYGSKFQIESKFWFFPNFKLFLTLFFESKFSKYLVNDAAR